MLLLEPWVNMSNKFSNGEYLLFGLPYEKHLHKKLYSLRAPHNITNAFSKGNRTSFLHIYNVSISLLFFHIVGS